jgi:hypothetical protein
MDHHYELGVALAMERIARFAARPTGGAFPAAFRTGPQARTGTGCQRRCGFGPTRPSRLALVSVRRLDPDR